MTNKEAIEILVGNRNFYERIVRPYGREMVEALNMAIKVLEEQEQPIGECKMKLNVEEQLIKKIIEKIDYVLDCGINPYSTREVDSLTAQIARDLSEAYKNLRSIGEEVKNDSKFE